MIKYYLLYVFNLAKYNIVKLLCLISILFCVNFLINYQKPDAVKKTSIVHQMKIEGYYIYTYKEIKDNNVEFNNLTYETPQKVINNQLITKSYSGLNIFVWVLFILSIITFLLVGFLNYWFDLHGVFEKTAFRFIKMDFEDGFYHYTLFNRLLKKSNNKLQIREVRHLLYNYSNLRETKWEPIFISKEDMREKKLNTLFGK